MPAYKSRPLAVSASSSGVICARVVMIRFIVPTEPGGSVWLDSARLIGYPCDRGFCDNDPGPGATAIGTVNWQPEHILVLEDEPTHRDVVAYHLASGGFRVATAAEATEALFLAQQEHFDLVLADYYLPDYPATDFVKLLREIDEYRRVPVILLTARADELNRQHLRDDLGLLVLSKPCSMESLLHTVSKCLAIARGAC